MNETPLCACWSGVFFFSEAAVLMLMMLALEMPMEDDETIWLRGEEEEGGWRWRGGGERERSPCRGCTRASSAAPCDREPGALRLAAVEPEDADGVMLLLVRLGAAITASPDHTTAPRRKGVWHRPAADTKRAQAPSRREVVWIAR